MSAADQENPKFQTHWATSKYCSIKFIFCQICFLHNGTQLDGEKCKFKKLQNKDHPTHQYILSIAGSDKTTER